MSEKSQYFLAFKHVYDDINWCNLPWTNNVNNCNLRKLIKPYQLNHPLTLSIYLLVLKVLPTYLSILCQNILIILSKDHVPRIIFVNILV